MSKKPHTTILKECPVYTEDSRGRDLALSAQPRVHGSPMHGALHALLSGALLPGWRGLELPDHAGTVRDLQGLPTCSATQEDTATEKGSKLSFHV